MQLNNCLSTEEEETLSRQLITVKYVSGNTISKSGGDTKFKRQFFYAIIPNKEVKKTTINSLQKIQKKDKSNQEDGCAS